MTLLPQLAQVIRLGTASRMLIDRRRRLLAFDVLNFGTAMVSSLQYILRSNHILTKIFRQVWRECQKLSQQELILKILESLDNSRRNKPF